ncbi:hypothetical protein ABPG75_013550 [Micractinium tetrahymenae]
MQRSTKAQAQAQAQRQEAIQPAQSIALCQALLRVSIYHVTYLRGIFPDEHYKPVDMRNLDNMEVHMLLPKDPESERLVQWVEGGVAHALERRYLRKVFFGFSRDAAGKDLLEEYVFSFSYDQDGGVHMAAGGSSRGGKEFSTKDAAFGSRGPTLNAVKYQVCRLMRMLVELTNTLEQVPDERYLFMKLTYTDDTPEDYEPPMFAPAADGGVGSFSRMPFVMEVGRVDTKHIRVGLAVKTVLDNMEDGWEDGRGAAGVEDNSELFSELPTTKAGAASAAASRHDTAKDESMGGGFSCAPPAAAKDVVDEVAQVGLGRVGSGSPHHQSQLAEADLEGVHAWAVGRPTGELSIIDAMARFPAIPSATLDACFAALVEQGLLVPAGEPDCFRLASAPAAAAPAAPSSPSAAALEEAQAAMEALRVRPLDSQCGGVHEVPGSQRTVSVAGAKRRQEAAASEGEAMLFPETQPSVIGGSKRQKKASFVEQPIMQGGKRQRKAAAQSKGAGEAAATGVRRSSRRR